MYLRVDAPDRTCRRQARRNPRQPSLRPVRQRWRFRDSQPPTATCPQCSGLRYADANRWKRAGRSVCGRCSLLCRQGPLPSPSPPAAPAARTGGRDIPGTRSGIADADIVTPFAGCSGIIVPVHHAAPENHTAAGGQDMLVRPHQVNAACALSRSSFPGAR